MKPLYKRVLLKLSGELLGSSEQLFSEDKIKSYCNELINLNKQGIELAIVLGGGNIFRGRELNSLYVDRADLDSIGMFSTYMNAMILKSYLSAYGAPSVILTSSYIQGVGEVYSKDKALEYLKGKSIVILAGGTALPYFSTDTASAVKAIDIKAEILLKATKTDGVYDKDPAKFKNVKKFDTISYEKILEKKLNVMDLTSITLCMEHRVKIVVFDATIRENISNTIFNKNIGTLISMED